MFYFQCFRRLIVCPLGWMCVVTLLVFSERSVADNTGRVIKDGVWAQLVFPIQTAPRTLSFLIGDDLRTEDYDSTWVVWAYEAEARRYVKLSVDDTVEIGHAYWVIQNTGDDVELDVPQEIEQSATVAGCVSNEGCLEVGVPALTNGSWSLRGSPYVGEVPVRELRVVTPVASSLCDAGYDLDRSHDSGVVANELFHYDSGLEEYVVLESDSTVGSWNGFWIRSLSDDEGPISLVFPTPQVTEVNSQLLDDFCEDTLIVSRGGSDESDAIRSLQVVGNTAIATVESSNDSLRDSVLRLSGVRDSIYARMALHPSSVYEGTGRAGASINFGPYNTIADGGNGDSQTGDAGFHLRIGFRGDGSPRFAFGAFHYLTETQIEDYLVLDGRSFRVFENLVPQVGVFYRLGIAIDRLNRTVTFSVDDTSLTYSLPTALFEPASAYDAIGARVDRGPASAVVIIDEVGSDEVSTDFSATAEYFNYNSSDRDKQNVSMEIQDGELRLESTSSGDNADARLRVTGVESSYVAAKVRLSSESIVEGEGFAVIRVGGPLYFANEIPRHDGLLDMVFAVSEIVMDENGGLEARYCAWQSQANDFSISTSLTNPASDSGCANFSLQPELDQNHTLSTWLDEETNRIVFAIDGEAHFVSIATPISRDDSLDSWVQARSAGAGSRVVAFADNLRVIEPGSGAAAVANGRISTLEQFQATIVGVALVQREADGSRDETTVLVVRSNGTVTGTVDGATVAIDWYWDGDMFCRSGTGGSVDSPFTIEFQCQVVSIASGVVTFANSLDESDARSYFVE